MHSVCKAVVKESNLALAKLPLAHLIVAGKAMSAKTKSNKCQLLLIRRPLVNYLLTKSGALSTRHHLRTQLTVTPSSTTTYDTSTPR